MQPSFTIGIEEEYQTVDPASRDLRSHIQTRQCDKLRGKGASRWLCSICQKDYSSKGNLQRHQENIHGVADGDLENAEIDADAVPANADGERDASPQSTAAQTRRTLIRPLTISTSATSATSVSRLWGHPPAM